MLVKIAYVRKDGSEAILRSTPEEILKAVEQGIRGSELFFLEREVSSVEEEALLWMEFVAKAAEFDKMDIAEEKCQIFFRKGMNLWTTFRGIPNVAIFMVNGDDMIVQVMKTASN